MRQAGRENPLREFYHAARNLPKPPGFYTVELSAWTDKNHLTKGECEMLATIGAWCIALFFVWYGLAAFVAALNTDMFRKIGAVLALVGGVVSVLGLLGM
jgi:hypothetical protein